MKRLCLPILLLASVVGSSSAADEPRPNFVFVISEDNSKHHLRHFDPTGIPTPNIKALAADGVTFDAACSNSPVCSVARSTLLSGCYLPRTGAQFHRKQQSVPMPGGLMPFPHYLKEAGYFTSNKGKTDYNFDIDFSASWSGKGDFTDRKSDDQPFFYQFSSISDSHESRGHFKASSMKKKPLEDLVASVTIPPHHPDTPTIRYAYAQYQSRMLVIDEKVGKLVAKLQDEGVYDNTIVFYFGDHGGILPRSKGYAYETGLNPPLVVRFPDRWQHLVPFEKGSRTSANVNFYDFGPSLLHAAGVAVDERFDGQPFLGEGITAEDLGNRVSFGYADRFDEKYDLVRTVRKGDLKYIRNYQPHYPDALHGFYRYKSLAYLHLRELHHEGKLDPTQSLFFQKKSPEALYDLATDPYETKNLAADPAYADQLAEMRGLVRKRALAINDLGFLPESTLLAEGGDDPTAYGEKHAPLIRQLVDLADLQLGDAPTAKPTILQALTSGQHTIRQWALTTATHFASIGEGDPEIAAAVDSLLEDESHPLVRTRAAEFLAHSGDAAKSVELLTAAAHDSTDPIELNLILNAAAVVYELDREQNQFSLAPDALQAESNLIKERLKYLGKPRP